MSLKTIRILSRIAFILYAVAFALTLLVTVLQTPILRSWYGRENPPYVFPLPHVINAVIRFSISLVFMILVNHLRTDRASRTAVLVIGIVLGVHLALGYPESIFYNMSIVNALSMEHSFCYSLLNSLLSWLNILTTPAYFLMVLAMGGFCNRAGRLNAVKESVIEPEFIYQEHKEFPENEALTDNDN